MSERAKARKAIRDLKLDQGDLATRIGFSPVHLCHVLRGRRWASRDLAAALARELKGRIDPARLAFEPPVPEPARAPKPTAHPSAA